MKSVVWGIYNIRLVFIKIVNKNKDGLKIYKVRGEFKYIVSEFIMVFWD